MNSKVVLCLFIILGITSCLKIGKDQLNHDQNSVFDNHYVGSYSQYFEHQKTSENQQHDQGISTSGGNRSSISFPGNTNGNTNGSSPNWSNGNTNNPNINNQLINNAIIRNANFPSNSPNNFNPSMSGNSSSFVPSNGVSSISGPGSNGGVIRYIVPSGGSSTYYPNGSGNNNYNSPTSGSTIYNPTINGAIIRNNFPSGGSTSYINGGSTYPNGGSTTYINRGPSYPSGSTSYINSGSTYPNRIPSSGTNNPTINSAIINNFNNNRAPTSGGNFTNQFNSGQPSLYGNRTSMSNSIIRGNASSFSIKPNNGGRF